MELTGWYSPYLQLTFDHILLTGACIWDRWKRLVPFELRPRDGGIAKRLQSEFEFFETLTPEADVTAVDNAFIGWLDGGFVRREAAYAEVLGKIAIERTAAKPHRMFKTENHAALVSKLDELGLTKDFAANWKGTSRLLQDLYLTCLVQHVRTSQTELANFPIIADDPLFGRAALHARGGFGHETGWHLTLELPMPAPLEWRIIERVNWEALKEYREASWDFRKKYIESVERCAAGVSLAPSAMDIPKVAQAHAAPVLDACKALIRIGERYKVPLERGYLLISWLPNGLRNNQAAIDPTPAGPIAYQLDRIPLAQGSVEKLAGDRINAWILSPEVPLAPRTGLHKLTSAVGRLFGGI